MERKGFHRILSLPLVYRTVQGIFSHKKTEAKWQSTIKSKNPSRVLDIGCGTGETAASFDFEIEYLGIDISENYVNRAREDYGNFGDFALASISDLPTLGKGDFDLVILKGVFHHLRDDEVEKFALDVNSVLEKGGRIVSIDPTFLPGRLIANFLARLDRGMHVRSPEELEQLLIQGLNLNRKEVIVQNFPPYQRMLMEFSHQGENV